MQTLMKSVSGIRGVIGPSMNPDLIVQTASAFARFVRDGKVILGRDSRPSGEPISSIFKSVLSMCGVETIDVGIVPTPTVQIMVRELNAAGGVVVSASHNPSEWNAFKLINSSGTFFNRKQADRFFQTMEDSPAYKKWDQIKYSINYNDAMKVHIKKVTGEINSRVVKNKKFKVALDSVNGAGSVITPLLLKELGCRVVPLNCEPTGIFNRGAEPIAENLKDLSALVMKNKASIGFAQDPDADRLAVIDEKGIPLGEELTVALVTEHILSKLRGPVVVNLSTTRVVEDIAAQYGVPFQRAAVGEINVVEMMKKKGAVIGGEGNGGVIAPRINYGRDSLAGIGYILEMMAERGEPVSGLAAALPCYHMIKEKIKMKQKLSDSDVVKEIRKQFPGEKTDTTDGVRVDFRKPGRFQGGWIHLRSSNTEPVFRVIAEGESREKAKEIYSYFRKLIASMNK